MLNTESLNDEFLTEEGNKLLITVKRYYTHSVYINQVFAPDGKELLHVRSWDIYPMMLTMASIYRQYNKLFELEILEGIISEMNKMEECTNGEQSVKRH